MPQDDKQDKLPGKWFSKNRYVGFHYDLHAEKDDADIGAKCDAKHLQQMFELTGCDWVQTDCKGHPGYTSWFSKTPSASIPPKLKKDALKQWRKATKALGLPLICHYSGVWDDAAAEKHPEWMVVPAEARAGLDESGQNAGGTVSGKMCLRSGYLEELLIPQMIELIDNWDVDGFWVDGDLWGVEHCYCDKCTAEFTKRTGIANPPTDVNHPDWPTWWKFALDSFNEYVTKYCDAVHAHNPNVLVCSNWLQTFKSPGAPAAPTDWISGDNTHVWGMDVSRLETRFISTRGKPWDLMLWAFYKSYAPGREDDASLPWQAKPPQMLMQEASVSLALGGNVQFYEHPEGLRDGRLRDWQMKRIGQVVKFAKKRRTLCQGSETIPQVAVLHSESHLYGTVKDRNLHWATDADPVRGATYAMLERHYGVDIMDEWALLPRIDDFPVIVAPEQYAMSKEMANTLKDYVKRGGKLLVTGAESFDTFGGKFLGVSKGKLEENAFQVPAGDGMTVIYSNPWRLTKATSAQTLGKTSNRPLNKEELLPYGSAFINKVGKGKVAYIPAAVFKDFEHNRYPMTSDFIANVANKLIGKLDIEVSAPRCVDVTLRTKGEKKLVHLINRTSGIPNTPHNGAVDEIPQVGPVTITMKLKSKPKSVKLAFENTKIKWKHQSGKLTVTVPLLHIHAAVVVE